MASTVVHRPHRSLLLYMWCCIASTSTLLLLEQVHGAPITAPDLTQCEVAVASAPVGPPLSLSFNCCLPVPPKGAKAVGFSLAENPPLRKRIRRPAHLASQEYIAKYSRAYELMRALPAEDPRSLAAQANIHCAFCNGAYKQPGTNVSLQVHFSWLFLPWHRWYLYFHERILGSLVGDPGFALLFWNWDNQLSEGESGAGGNMMPPMFALDSNSSLYDAKRNQAHLPPALVRLNTLSNTTDNSVIVSENLNFMYQSMVTAATPDLFFGGAYRLGTDLSNSTVVNAPLGGSVENSVHNGIHFWTGDPAQQLLQDMGNFATASRDPIFYAHHSNIDRLWEAWRSLPGGRRQPPVDPDFLDTEFLFYDENANLVKVKARDSLDTRKLGVSYKKAKGDDLWLNFQPQPVSNGSAVAAAQAEGLKEFGPASSAQQPKKLGRRFRALVRRPLGSKPNTSEEVLVLQGVELTRDRFAQLLVFVNLPDADQDTPVSGAEYVGSFNVIAAPVGARLRRLLTNVRLEVGDNLRRIGIQDDALVVITVVVKTSSPDADADADAGPFDASLQGIEINYQ